MPTLDAKFGIAFRPFTRLSVRLLVCASASTHDEALTRLYEAYGPFVRAEVVNKPAELKEAIACFADTLAAPPVVIRDDVIENGLTKPQKRDLLAAASNIRSSIVETNVRRLWVYIGLRAEGSTLRQLTATSHYPRFVT